jgi:hypothetical protein
VQRHCGGTRQREALPGVSGIYVGRFVACGDSALVGEPVGWDSHQEYRRMANLTWMRACCTCHRWTSSCRYRSVSSARRSWLCALLSN